ncbi:retinoic acid receptor RXR-alpha [Puma concolor]|uniref:Retinoic acid receptor RXR-alpha n=1 Tax=Puma concolor TaxID=9696 RepID=A0A6P6HVJ9_PUMCO|nr:retinoic acid receptor RXR-alpha [Puma concolor]
MALGGGGRAGRKLGSGPEGLQRLESADLSCLLCRSVTWGLQERDGGGPGPAIQERDGEASCSESGGVGIHPAVQEERQRGKDRNENEVESTSSANEDMPVEKILEAELAVEPKTETYVDANMGLNPNSPNDPVTNICQAADKQLFTLVEWAKRIPHFSELPLDDQVILLRAGWNELLIASFSHRSIAVKDGILLATGLHVHRNSAHSAGVGAIFDRKRGNLTVTLATAAAAMTQQFWFRCIHPSSPGSARAQGCFLLRPRAGLSPLAPGPPPGGPRPPTSANP